MKIKTAISKAEVSKGFLTHSLENNPDYKPEVEIKYRDIIRLRDSIVFVNNEVPVPVEKPLKLWQKILMGFATIGVLATAWEVFRLIYRFRPKA